MPIFEYECSQCRKRFEHLQRRAGELPSECPYCAGRKLKKVFSAFSVSASASGPKHEPSEACSTCSHGTCPYSEP